MPASTLPRPPRFALLTPGASNPKTAKGDPLGYGTAVLHLAPSDLSGKDVCPFASPACIAGCLNRAGRGGVGGPDNTIQRARIRRTRMLHADRAAFWALLVNDIRRHIAWCERVGLSPAVRLNGTSDIPWAHRKDPASRQTIMALFPGVQFYDYTKRPVRLWGSIPANYHLTFSLSELNDDDAREALEAGANVAVVFALRPGKGGKRPRKGDPLPTTFMGRPVVDADDHDLRFLDPQGGVVAGLRAKSNTLAGRAAMAASGFARAAA